MSYHHRLITVFFCIALFLLGISGMAEATVFRVAATATGANPDGQDWKGAYPTIQAAVNVAVAGDEIWVAGGVYTTDSGDEVVSAIRGLIIYGGFSGTETSREQRDQEKYPTIIDGKGVRRCVTAGEDVEIDGFTLQNGKALDGGGMYGGTARHCVFSGNSAENSGGGMSVGSATDCIFTANTASSGGGCSSTNAVHCTFKNNTASQYGGGAYMGDLTGCTFTKNVSSQDGGGAWEARGVNCLFVENSAVMSGGGFSGGSATYCTFVGNVSVNDQAGGMAGGMAANCIFWGNGKDLEEHSRDVWNCCISRFYSDFDHKNNFSANPKFVNPREGDFRIQADSPCIDKGDNMYGMTTVDLLERQRPQGSGYDIGAYEYYKGDDAGVAVSSVVLYVNAASTASSPDGSSWTTAFPSLRDGLAQASYGTEIWVAEGVYTADSGDEVVHHKLFTGLYGGFSGTETRREQRNWTMHPTIIDGQHARRCVTAYNDEIVDGFILQNGSSDGGGGMSRGIAQNCILRNNKASWSGGGMDFGTAINCLFIENASGQNCGGLAYGTVINCTFVRNSAREVCGGFGGSTATNSIFWQNSPDDTSDWAVLNSCLSGGTDPLFVNADGSDFRLQAASPCINTGTADQAPSTDFLGVGRPQQGGIDIGAYEYVDASPEGESEGEGEVVIEGETPSEGEGEVVIEGETPSEGEGEVIIEGETPSEGEGEVIIEGETPSEGEGEVIVEGETPSEGEGEILVEGEAPPEGEPVVEGEPVSDITAAAQALLDDFTAMDADGSGLLSYTEAAARLGGLTQEQFKTLDTDGDGRLSQAELEDYLGEGGCFGCHGPKRNAGDLFLSGLSLLALAVMVKRH